MFGLRSVNVRWSFRPGLGHAHPAASVISALVHEHVNTWPLRDWTRRGTEPAGLIPQIVPHRKPSINPPVDPAAVCPLSRMTDEQLFVPQEEQAVAGGPLRDFRRLTRLYCMNGGHHLQILPDGTVQGQREDGDAHSKRLQHKHFTSRSDLQHDAFTSSTAAVSGSKTQACYLLMWGCES